MSRKGRGKNRIDLRSCYKAAKVNTKKLTNIIKTIYANELSVFHPETYVLPAVDWQRLISKEWLREVDNEKGG